MAKSKDRLFNDKGWKHYRPTYSLNEVRVGLSILLGLAGIVGWVAYRGAHPDPELFEAAPGQKNRAKGRADRGPLPEGLAPEGWREGMVSFFGEDNLYEKINGRETYYKSFGCQGLHFVSLSEDANPERTVDLELYAMSSAQNALGAYAGEVGGDAKPELVEGGLAHYTKNALFLTRGPLYLRAIGADASPAVRSVLERLRSLFIEKVKGEALPQTYALFVGRLGLDPGKVAYFRENAFSFAFGKDVHVAVLPDGQTEVFLKVATDESAAKALAARFRDGFRQYGEGDPWVVDRYQSRVSGADASGRVVVGVRSAENSQVAKSWTDKLGSAVNEVSLEGLSASPPSEEQEGETESGDDEGPEGGEAEDEY